MCTLIYAAAAAAACCTVTCTLHHLVLCGRTSWQESSIASSYRVTGCRLKSIVDVPRQVTWGAGFLGVASHFFFIHAAREWLLSANIVSAVRISI